MNIVIGAGIAGLIYAYYHHDHIVLSDQVGGQMMSYFDLGPRYLHNKSQKVIDFLHSLKLPIKKTIIRVGYIDDSGWVENPDSSFRQKYFMKSRCQSNLEGFDPSVLNTNIKEFEVCDVDFKDLIMILFNHLGHRIYTGKVEEIDLKERFLKTDTKMSMKFDKLVSTIPLNIFSWIAKLNLKLEAYDMSYCLMKNDFFDLKQYDYVYDARTSTISHRMTKSKYGVVCDVFGLKTKEFEKQSKDMFAFEIENSIRYVKNNQIISLEKDFSLDDKSITFIGRYGSWCRRWKTETVIEESQK
jgi:hypothetical protein